jgi:hypothetical protein
MICYLSESAHAELLDAWSGDHRRSFRALFLAFFRGFLFAKAIVVETIIAAQSALRSAMTRTESFADDVPEADFAS